MESIDFLAPFYKVIINGQEESVSNFDIWSARDNPSDICTVEVIKGATFKDDMPVEVILGYRDNWVWHVFTGYVTKIRPQPSTVIIESKDEMQKLITKKVKQAFINALPQEIIRYGLKAAGVTQYELSAKSFQRKTLNVPNLSVKELVEAVNKTWGLSFPFFFNTDKKFYWKEAGAANSEMAVFEYGKNIIDIESFGDTLKLITFLAPFIGHSEHIKVLHPDLPSEIYTVSKVRWFTNKKGFPRTHIYMEAV